MEVTSSPPLANTTALCVTFFSFTPTSSSSAIVVIDIFKVSPSFNPFTITLAVFPVPILELYVFPL